MFFHIGFEDNFWKSSHMCAFHRMAEILNFELLDIEALVCQHYIQLNRKMEILNNGILTDKSYEIPF